MSTRRAIVVAAFLALATTQVLAADNPEAGMGHVDQTARADAMNKLGIRYATGNGVPKDFVAALAWYQRAAESGSTSAMNNIATIYFHGLGVPRSYEEAVKWLRLAAQQKDPIAQNSLGTMYAGGFGVPQNDHEAFELFDLAAAQGYGPGMVNLGRLYALGSGVKRDDIRAYALISAGFQIGVPANVRDAALYQLGALSQRLDAKQLERAQADARTLLDAPSKESPVAGEHKAYRL